MTRKEAVELVRCAWSMHIDYIQAPPSWMSERTIERRMDIRTLSSITDFLESFEKNRVDTGHVPEILALMALKDVLRALLPRDKWTEGLSEYFLRNLLKRWDARLRWFPDEAAVTWPLERFVREICDEPLLLSYGTIALTGKDSKTRVDARRKLAALLVHIIGMLQERQRLSGKEK